MCHEARVSFTRSPQDLPARAGLTIFWSLLLLMACGPPAAGEPEYVVRDLGAIGDGSSRALGINEAGQVVGLSQTGEFSPEGYSGL